MGCDPARCRVIANGINYDRLSKIPLKIEDGMVDIGAVVRMAPIKDIKTMIYAFYELSDRRQDVRLHIMGGVDDPQYDAECRALVRSVFTPGFDRSVYHIGNVRPSGRHVAGTASGTG